MTAAVMAASAYLAAALAGYFKQSLWLAALAALAIGLHAFVLIDDIFGAGLLRINILDAASLVLLQASAILLLGWRLLPTAVMMQVIAPLAGLGAVAGAWSTGASLDGGVAQWHLQVHIGLSIFAAGLFTLAALQSLLVAVQSRYLHYVGTGRAWTRELPPLQRMETLLFGIVWAAWASLTAALLTGIVFVDDIFAQHLVHKTTLSLVSWMVFALLLWGRWQYGWRGRTALRWTWAGFGILLLAYFGSKFVLEQLLGQRWG